MDNHGGRELLARYPAGFLGPPRRVDPHSVVLYWAGGTHNELQAECSGSSDLGVSSMISDADFCRAMGWGPGTILAGFNERKKKFVIRITAIGESAILARRKRAAEGDNWDLAVSNCREATKEEYAASR